MSEKYIIYADDPRRRRVIGGSLLGNIFTLIWPTLVIFGGALYMLNYVKNNIPDILEIIEVFKSLL